VADLQLRLVATPSKPSALKLALKKTGAKVVSEPLPFTDIYYDSPDLKLRQQGLSFSVQEQGERRIQVLKRLGSAVESGSTDECSDPISTDQPDPLAPETGPRLRSIANGYLHPLFKTQGQRRLFHLNAGSSAEIAAALDEGEICGADGGDTQRVCELGLELKRGDAAVLYDLALQLLHATPLRIETQSRPERGYRLSGVTPEAIMAKPPAVEPSMTVEAFLLNAGREGLAHLLRNEPAAMAGEAEGFHQMRVALRRLHAVLSAVRSMFPPEQYQWLRGELKWLTGSLGPARNWDVFATELLAPIRSVLVEHVNLAQLAVAAETQRQAAYHAAKDAIETQRYAESILKLARWFESRGWRDQRTSEHSAPLFASIADVAPSLIERHWREARKRSRHFGKLSQAERHRVRISLKKLRYTIEFLGGLFDGDAVSGLLKPVKRLQDDLGRVNDIRTAHNLIKEITFSVTEEAGEIGQEAGIILGWHIRGLWDAECTLRRDVRRFRKAKPFWGPFPCTVT
jgi:inorganic triphosphatase YgiF